MPQIHCFTSMSFNYLAKARVLASSLKRFHPDWTFWVCITDREPVNFFFDIDAEPFDNVIWSDEIQIDDIKSWMFKHDIVEICTAVKGFALQAISESCSSSDKIFYIDPDIAVFSPLNELVKELDNNDILLTPHQIEPEKCDQSIIDNEISSLQHGIYNLGFLGINNSGEGSRFIDWWCKRLKSFCYNEIPSGLFVDQRWCDLVPAFFEKVKILRDPGCNVASWNLSHRDIVINTQGEILVNGSPLKFYHFTKIYGTGIEMINRYSNNNIHIYELISWYKNEVKRFDEMSINVGWWHYGTYDNGVKIESEHRLLYRKSKDLQHSYKDPYATEGDSLYSWIQNNKDFWKDFVRENDHKEDNEQTLKRIVSTSRWNYHCHELKNKINSKKVKEIIVYGAGEVGKTFVSVVKNSDIDIQCIVDRNPLLWGQHIDGIEIKNLPEAQKCDVPVYVIASFAYIEEISDTILNSYVDSGIEPTIFSLSK
jgi:hypothetical protein